MHLKTDAKTIHIRQQAIELNGAIIIDSPKTAASVRELPLLPHIEVLLAAKRAQSPNAASDALVFQTKNGTCYRPNNVSRTFVKLSKGLGLPRICIHEIRHTVATMMKDSGVPVKDAQTTLGHSNIQTTLQIYQHRNLENKNTALQLINNAVMR